MIVTLLSTDGSHDAYCPHYPVSVKMPGSSAESTVDSFLPPCHLPAEDRNRTSPFPYGGHRFEFRAVGSSQVRKCQWMQIFI